MHHSRQDAFDAAARARAGHAAEWHPVLAAVEQRPGCWHMTTPYGAEYAVCLLYTSPSPRDRQKSRMPSSA